MNNPQENVSKPLIRRKKPGRTLLVKVNQDEDSSSVNEILNGLQGLQSNVVTEKTSSHFLTFDSVDNSLAALKTLKRDHSDKLRVKFAHYRVFFTMKGLTEETDYNTVKQEHTKYIEENTGGNVLYYKLYKKNNNYLECGDLTVDTKNCFDNLMTDDDGGFRNYNLSESLSGKHFRYNRNRRSDDVEPENALA
jgi:hypothetical protein